VNQTVLERNNQPYEKLVCIIGCLNSKNTQSTNVFLFQNTLEISTGGYGVVVLVSTNGKNSGFESHQRIRCTYLMHPNVYNLICTFVVVAVVFD
jgi:hypothetical protein